MLDDPARAAAQALGMVTEGRVTAIDGTAVDLRVDTLCVHGDNPAAAGFLRTLRRRLADAGVALRPMRAVLAAHGAPGR